MSTTVKADTTSDILNAYTYKYYVVDKAGVYKVFLSDVSITQKSYNSSTSFYDINIGIWTSINANTYYIADIYKSTDNPIILVYNQGIWKYEFPVVRFVTNDKVNGNYKVFCFSKTSEITTFTTSMPAGFPVIDLNSGVTMDQVQAEINDKLNATTSVTTQANNIQTQITNNYISYSNGDIDLATLQANIDSLAQQLENLNNSSGATIADKIAINNAITQTQLVQDAANKDAIIAEMEEDLTVSSSVSATITGKINQANQIFNQYSQGSITQTEAVTQINQYITQLTQLITPQTPTADINAINSAINTINGIKDSVTTHSELSPDVSEEQVQSDQEEIEMLNEMMSVMQEQVVENKMEDQQVAGQAGDINSILEPIWNNKYMTYLVGVSGVLILACIVLHTKYRML